MTERLPDPKKRFSDRVANYVRYRPSYPSELFDTLREEFGLAPGQTVADIGSGTGIFSELLREQGLAIIAIEPNDAMRASTEKNLRQNQNFTSVSASAEATTLPDSSVDWIFAAQAFHWFDVEQCRSEFARILRTEGHVVLVWNNRRHDTPFAKEYEKVLQELATDYATVRHDGAEAVGRIDALFAPLAPEVRRFDNQQRFDLTGLTGRTFSSSYTPPPGDPRHEVLAEALGTLFNSHEIGGEVVMHYETRTYIGRIA